MKKIENLIMCTLFAVLCGGIPLAGGIRQMLDSQTAEEENRSLAVFPQIKGPEDILSFSSEFEQWYSDHLFLKSDFVRIKSELEIRLFKELDSEKVVLGTKKGWLFHKSNDGQPMETYKKTNYFTQEELKDTAENLQTLNEELDSMGTKFIVMIAPDKEEIYGKEYMPASTKQMEGPGRTVQFLDYMAKMAPEVRILYPAEAIEQAKGQWEQVESLYYESDTHWNQAGAYAAAGALLEEISRQTGEKGGIPDLTFVKGGTSRGDLQKLVKLGKDYDSREYEAEGLPEAEVSQSVTDRSGEVIYEAGFCQDTACIPATVYLAGDSFRWNLSPYLKAGTAESFLVSRYYFDPEDLAVREPQVFVYMIAERYLHELSVIPGYNTAALQMP